MQQENRHLAVRRKSCGIIVRVSTILLLVLLSVGPVHSLEGGKKNQNNGGVHPFRGDSRFMTTTFSNQQRPSSRARGLQRRGGATVADATTPDNVATASTETTTTTSTPSTPTTSKSPHHHHHHPHRSWTWHWIHIMAHGGAVVAAILELAEDWEETEHVLASTSHKVGHGHGILFLIASKVCRELALLRESLLEEVEEIQEVLEEVSHHHDESSKTTTTTALHPKSPSRKPTLLRSLWRGLTSPLVAQTLAVAALGAASLEVVEDLSPGGHHGAVALAIFELEELLVASHMVQDPGLVAILEHHVFRLGLALLALATALYEAIASKKVGAHHGVFLLALSKLVRIVGLVHSEWAAEVEEEEKQSL